MINLRNNHKLLARVKVRGRIVERGKEERGRAEERGEESPIAHVFFVRFFFFSLSHHSNLLLPPFRKKNEPLSPAPQAFDRHCNMVLENVKEMWTDAPKAGGAAAKGAGARRARVARDRFVPKMFLRGDSVILVLRNPK